MHFDRTRSSGKLISDAKIADGPGVLDLIGMISGTESSPYKADFYDSTTDGGCTNASFLIGTKSSIMFDEEFTTVLATPVRFKTGLYVKISGTGTGAYCHYRGDGVI